MEVGGAAVPDDTLYDRVAAKMGSLTLETGYDSVHARPKWVYELQWVRHALVKQGEMDGSRRGLWRITEKGRERVRLEWDGFEPQKYANELREVGAGQIDEQALRDPRQPGTPVAEEVRQEHHVAHIRLVRRERA